MALRIRGNETKQRVSQGKFLLKYLKLWGKNECVPNNESFVPGKCCIIVSRLNYLPRNIIVDESIIDANSWEKLKLHEIRSSYEGNLEMLCVTKYSIHVTFMHNLIFGIRRKLISVLIKVLPKWGTSDFIWRIKQFFPKIKLIYFTFTGISIIKWSP